MPEDLDQRRAASPNDAPYDGAVRPTQRRVAARKAAWLENSGVIREAAGRLFLTNGYLGTSMDENAAHSGVSNQHVYTHFEDKEPLFTELIRGNTNVADAFIASIPSPSQETLDLEGDLHALGRRYIGAVIQPRVLQLRRLIIGEA